MHSESELTPAQMFMKRRQRKSHFFTKQASRDESLLRNLYSQNHLEPLQKPKSQAIKRRRRRITEVAVESTNESPLLLEHQDEDLM